MVMAFGGSATDSNTPAPKPWLRVGGVVLGLSIAVSLMLFAFLAPSINSGPHQLPLAVSGPTGAVQQLTDRLEQASPGAFEIINYADAAEVTIPYLTEMPLAVPVSDPTVSLSQWPVVPGVPIQRF